MAVGIICEYNPFHRGHAWQIGEIRRTQGENTAIVCAMSGNFVQRGDFAVMEKHRRAEAAIRGGADLVMEIPLPWAIVSAEGFAAGGVSVLAASGVVDTLAFGSECADAQKLLAAADCLRSEQFAALLRQKLKDGTSFAAAREAAAAELADVGEVLSAPNDILGVEYCKAIAAQGAVMKILPLARKGAQHDGAAADGIASATEIRRMLCADEPAGEYMTEASRRLYEQERSAGRAPVRMETCERAILAVLRGMSEEELRAYDSGAEGLYHRFYDAAHTACGIEELLAAVKTKRYAYARVRRMLLAAYLGVSALPERVPYLRVLAANERGRTLLREMKRTAALPILTKPAEVRKLDAQAQAVFAAEAAATDRYVLAYPSLAEAKPGSEWTTDPIIL